MRMGLLTPVLQRGRVAVICEECHRAHFEDGATFAAVSRLFGTGDGQPGGLSYIGFTGTPGRSALRLFGRLERSPEKALAWQSDHCYHLGQAEKDGVVLNILENYQDVELESKAVSAKAEYILKDLQVLCRTYDPPFAARLKAMLVCESRADVVSYVLALRELLRSGSWVLPVGGRQALKSLGLISFA